MGRRSFDVVDLLELFTHWEAGRSQSQIADSLNLDRKTVRKYTAPLAERGLEPGGPPAGEQVWEQRIAEWFPEVVDRRLRQVTWPQIEAHRGLHRRAARRGGDGVHDQSAAGRRAGAGCVGVVAAAVDERESG